MSKLALLKEYISIQAENEGLWFMAETATEAYLQQELRRVAWLIEEATEAQIQAEIDNHNALKKELGL